MRAIGGTVPVRLMTGPAGAILILPRLDVLPGHDSSLIARCASATRSTPAAARSAAAYAAAYAAKAAANAAYASSYASAAHKKEILRLVDVTADAIMTFPQKRAKPTG